MQGTVVKTSQVKGQIGGQFHQEIDREQVQATEPRSQVFRKSKQTVWASR